MNYAFLQVAQEFQLEIITRFQNDSKINASYISSAVKEHFHGDKENCIKILDKIVDQNPDLILKKIDDFLFTEAISKLIKVPWVISEEDIVRLKHIESISMRLMDRSSLIPISNFSRRRLYLILLNYFTYLIEKQKIDVLVVFDTPHSYYDIVYYELCKSKNIRVIKLEYHFLTDYSILLNQDEWPVIPENFMENGSVEDYNSLLPDSLSKSIFKNSLVLQSYKSKETKAIVKLSSFSSFKLYLRYLKKSTQNIIMGMFPFLFKKEILHFASLNGLNNRLVYRLLLNVQLFKLINLNVFYNKIANKNLSLNVPYVFVGLHMQPEKTSQPMGGEFDNQLMMVKILSDSVPEGWKVYVKEHPNQFNVKKVPNRHYRDRYFYECIQLLDNVEFVPLELDSKDMIENSKMVATLTGTLGWEAITKSIPALVFGYTYYMNCGAVRKITSVETCKRAILELSELKSEDFKREIYRYLAYYYSNNWLVAASNMQSVMHLNSNSYQTQVDNLLERITCFHKKIKDSRP